MSETMFFISVTFIAYTYLGYFLLIALRGNLFPRSIQKRYHTPPVTVIMVARNDEISVRARLENLRDQDYPSEMVEIIVVCDGSTDRTADIAREFGGENVVVIELAEAVGRSRAINEGMNRAKHEIAVFAGVRQAFSPNVLAELTAVLWDETVGAVSGELVVEAGARSEIHAGLEMYWRYEKFIRRMESAAGSVVGATGPIYAIRRHLFAPLAPQTLLDDFIISMRIVMQGYRAIYLRSARAFDISSNTAVQELRTRARALAGGLQAVALEPRLVDPKSNPLFLEFVSHRLARLAVPYFFVVSLVASAASDGLFYGIMFWLQAALLGLGLIRYTPLRRTRLGALGRVSWTFTILNGAAVAALWMYITGRERAVWGERGYAGAASASRKRSVRSTP
jgi:biofilm PGA synthesis N-glycosyltransferase PgaC